MKVGIVGLGLIGGSLALDLKEKGLEIIGVSKRQSTCNLAIEKGIVNGASINFDILQNTDLIIICTPINLIIPTLKSLIPYVDSQTVISDVASVKMDIVYEGSSLWANFIGGHPMAGTSQQGIEAIQAHLFKNAPYVLTPISSTSDLAIAKMREIIELIESKIYICEPKIHDQAVALISHLPVVISANLIYTALSEKDKKVLELAKKLASSGFKDTSRVGGGNPELGLMMAKYNRQNLLSFLCQYRENLDLFIKEIEQENWQNLEEILQQTAVSLNDFRD